MKKLKYAISCCIFSMPFIAQAQNNVATYSLLDEGQLSLIEQTNSTFKNLTDKNDTTLFQIKDATTNTIIQYEAQEPVVVTAYSMVSSFDENLDPKQWKFQYSSDGESWRTLHIKRTLFEERNIALKTLTALPVAGNGYKYYRIVFENTTEGQSFSWGLTELQLFGMKKSLTPNLTNNGGVLTGEYNGSSDYPLAKLTDNTYGRFAQNGINSYWVQYESAEPVRLGKYGITSGLASAKVPRAWELLASNDGLSWDLLDDQRNQNFFDAPYFTQIYNIGTPYLDLDWDKCSDALYKSLMDIYWRELSRNGRTGYHFLPRASSDPAGDGYNYWWMAHALDLYVDRYNRTGDKNYKIRIDQLGNGLLAFGKGSYYHGFYDDMEWMGLAYLRAYQALEVDSYWTTTKQLWKWVTDGWNEDFGGGINWSAGTVGKNACANAPAVIFACRMYNQTKDNQYLEFAKKTYEWMDGVLVDQETGVVWDNIHKKKVNDVVTDENELDKTVWSYNIGTWIGACLELYMITGEQKYLDKALVSSDNAVNDYRKFSQYGIVNNWEYGGGDGGLFKPIFVRYFAQLIMSGVLDADRQAEYTNYIIKNGEIMWNSGVMKPEMIISPSWFKKPEDTESTPTRDQYSSTMIGATMVFEIMDELKRKDLLPASNPIIAENAEKEYKYFKLHVHNRNGSGDAELTEWQLFKYDGSSIDNSVTIDNPIAIETAKNTIKLVVQDNTMPAQWKVIDLKGAVVASGELVEEQSVSVQAGIYIVNVVDKQVSYSQKVVVR